MGMYNCKAAVPAFGSDDDSCTDGGLGAAGGAARARRAGAAGVWERTSVRNNRGWAGSLVEITAKQHPFATLGYKYAQSTVAGAWAQLRSPDRGLLADGSPPGAWPTPG